MASRTTQPGRPESPDPEGEHEVGAIPPRPTVSPSAAADVSAPAPSNPDGGPTDGPAPQWPSRGWALQPRRANGQPRRSKGQRLGATAGIALGSLAVVGGLFAWAASSTFAGETNHAWAAVPQGQPYYQPMIKPDIPASATAAKLPLMTVATPTATVTLKIDTPPLGGMYGGTGQVQDAYSPAYFSVPAGETVHVTVINYDQAWHTFTAPALGLNVWVRPAGSHPSKTTFSFTTPSTGYFEWFCDLPCDGWSMQAPGYMEGEIHAVKA